MGLGDEVMVTAIVKKTNNRNYWKYGERYKYAIVDGSNKPRWHEIWQNNPFIQHPDNFDKKWPYIIQSGPGHRPYMDSNGRWKEWGIEPGEIYLSDIHKYKADRISEFGYVAICPFAKHANKDWGWNKFVKLVKTNPHIKFCQLTPDAYEKPLIPGIRMHYFTYTAMEFAAAMSAMKAFVSNEGGMHHVAACFGKPGVVIFGGFIHPRFTGYNIHTNLVGSERICNSWAPCPHCKKALAAITVEQVSEELNKIIDKENTIC